MGRREPSLPPEPTYFQPQEQQSSSDSSLEGVEDILAELEARRGSRVIALVHRHPLPQEHPESWRRQELIGPRHMEDFLAALAAIPRNARLDVILHSIGGQFMAVQQIARAIKAHGGETTVFVPHHARAYSTLIALAADKLVAAPTAAFSFLEPLDQTLEQVIRQKGRRRISDDTAIRLHMERSWARETREFICELTHDGAHHGRCQLAHDLAGGARTSWSPMTVAFARSAGVKISTDVPPEVFKVVRANRTSPEIDHGVKAPPTLAGENSIQQARAFASSAWRAHADARPRLFEYGANRDVGAAPQSSAGEDRASCSLIARPFIARLEERRGSHVLCIIHSFNMESARVDLMTAEDAIDALNAIDRDAPLDIVLHTPGGGGFEGEQIARALKAHRGRKTVFVPFFAMSAGTIISLAADEIVMSDHASLGPIDAQIGGVPTRAILSVLETKPKTKIDDELLELAIRAKRNMKQDHALALELMAGVYPARIANKVAHRLNDGELSHSYPLTNSAARKLGLNVSNAMPSEPAEIVRAFRREGSATRSVLFCPPASSRQPRQP
jgi:ClpP class serine protease